MVLFFVNPFRWKKTEHEVNVSQAVPNVSSGNSRRLAFDAPAPANGTIVSQGHLRLFVPDEFIRVGTVRFGSSNLVAPLAYKVDTSGAPQFHLPQTDGGIRLLHGSEENVQALMASLNRASPLIDNRVKEGLKTGTQNASVTTLGAGTVCVLVGTLAGGPVGAAVGAGVAGILGIVVGLGSGVAQAYALDQAHGVEEELRNILKFWVGFLNGESSASFLRDTYRDFSRQHESLRNARPGDIQRMVFDSLMSQLDEILAEEGRLGIVFRGFLAQQAQQGTGVQVQKTRSFESPDLTKLRIVHPQNHLLVNTQGAVK